MLLRGGSRAAVAATAFDVPGVLAAADELARGLAGRLLPGFVGGGGTYARQLFRRDGFFAYADERQAQVGSLQALVWPDLCEQLVIVGSKEGAASGSCSGGTAALPTQISGRAQMWHDVQSLV